MFDAILLCELLKFTAGESCSIVCDKFLRLSMGCEDHAKLFDCLCRSN